MKPYKKKIINSIVIFVVFSIGLQASAQINADSLESVLKTAGKSEKLSILNTLADYYLILSPGKAIEYGTQAINLADEINDAPQKITAILNMGDAYLKLGDDRQSLNNYQKALDEAKSASLQKETAQASLKIGNYYNLESVYHEALKYDLDALKIYKTLGDDQGLSDCYNNISIVYYYLGSYDKSLEFCNQALEIREKLKDIAGISKSFNNMGMIYMSTNKNEKALEYYFKALKLTEENYNVNDQAITLGNIGITYKQMGDNEKAISYYLQSLSLYDQFTNNRTKTSLYVFLGITYTDLKQYDKAEEYFNQGLELAKKSGFLDMIALNYKYLADLYLMIGNYKKTLDYKDLYFTIKDSVFNDANKKRIAEFQIRIETDNTQREAELIREKSNLLYLFFILLAVTIVIIVLILYSRHKTKHHADIALNNLNFNNLEANISIEKLILWSNYQNGKYKFTPENIDLADELVKGINQYKSFTESKNLNIISSVTKNTIVCADQTALNLITRFIILNSIKNSVEESQINISSKPEGEFIVLAIVYKSLAIKSEEISRIFETNIQQIVINKENEAGENLGFALCKEFIEKSGGNIRLESLHDQRIGLTVSLPVKA